MKNLLTFLATMIFLYPLIHYNLCGGECGTDNILTQEFIPSMIFLVVGWIFYLLLHRKKKGAQSPQLVSKKI